MGYPLELVAGLRTLEAPMSVMTDSYKAGHYLMYPECKSMTAYGEFRSPFPEMDDNRFVVSIPPSAAPFLLQYASAGCHFSQGGLERGGEKGGKMIRLGGDGIACSW